MEKQDCKHQYNYIWRRGKCKGSKCILCGHIDKTMKPVVTTTVPDKPKEEPDQTAADDYLDYLESQW